MLWFQGAIPAAIASAKRSGAVFVVFVAGDWGEGPRTMALLACSGFSLASSELGRRSYGGLGSDSLRPCRPVRSVSSGPLVSYPGQYSFFYMAPGLLRCGADPDAKPLQAASGLRAAWCFWGLLGDSGVTSLHLCGKRVQALSPITETCEESRPAGLGNRVVAGRPPPPQDPQP